jgi:2',5'-phosphodiesterase
MKTFQLYILPIMRDHGYDGHYTNKAGGVLEGCATITKSKKLKVLHRIDIPLKNVLRNAAILKGIYSIRPDLRDVLGGKLGTIGQITVCQCLWNPARVILIANTHLFYHPSAGFVRLLQTDVITRTMLDIRTYIETAGLEGLDQLICEGEDRSEGGNRSMDHLNKGENKGGRSPQDRYVKPPTVSVLFMGDFNSTSETAVIEYLDTGVILSEHEVWETINTFHWGQRSESETDTKDTLQSSGSDCTTSTGLRKSSKIRSAGLNDAHGAILTAITPTLSHPFSLISASSTPYTNYTKGFKDILDYIYYQSDHLRVIRVAPFPSEDILSQDVALPSQHFPSDHLAVAVDLMLI